MDRLVIDKEVCIITLLFAFVFYKYYMMTEKKLNIYNNSTTIHENSYLLSSKDVPNFRRNNPEVVINDNIIELKGNGNNSLTIYDEDYNLLKVIHNFKTLYFSEDDDYKLKRDKIYRFHFKDYNNGTVKSNVIPSTVKFSKKNEIEKTFFINEEHLLVDMENEIKNLHSQILKEGYKLKSVFFAEQKHPFPLDGVYFEKIIDYNHFDKVAMITTTKKHLYDVNNIILLNNTKVLNDIKTRLNVMIFQFLEKMEIKISEKINGVDFNSQILPFCVMIFN